MRGEIKRRRKENGVGWPAWHGIKHQAGLWVVTSDVWKFLRKRAPFLYLFFWVAVGQSTIKLNLNNNNKRVNSTIGFQRFTHFAY